MIEGHGDDIYNYPDIELNFSSNIYPLADIAKVEERIKECSYVVRSYPEPSANSLEIAIATHLGISPANVIATNGATEAIYLIARSFSHLKGYKILYPTFSEYEDACKMASMQSVADESKRGIFWLCNPNNPDGAVRPKEFITNLLRNYDIVVADQSYEDYTLEDIFTPAEGLKFSNLIQIHSMTKKYAVPGLRLGYITANESIIQRLRANSIPWGVNAIAIEIGKYLINERGAVEDMRNYLKETQRLSGLLAEIDGIIVTPTQTNFILAESKKCSAKELKHYLATQKRMLIRDASNFKELTEGHFRVAAASKEADNMLVEAIKEYLSR